MLDPGTKNEVKLLYEEAKEHEATQAWVTLRAIRDLYELILPRVMFVVRRVIKVMKDMRPTSSK